MATRTVARMYDSYADASAAVRALEAAGFSHDDVSLIANRPEDTGGTTTAEEGSSSGTGAGTGATIGTLIGGGAGLLAGLGALAIPGVGPVVAAGWLVATLAGAGVGAATGGLLGGLVGAGIGEEHAKVYAEGVRRGGSLVTVRAEEGRLVEAERILDTHNPVDVERRAGEYRAGGWTGADETGAVAPPLSGVGAAAGVGTTTAAGQMGTRTRDYPTTDAAVGGAASSGTMGSRSATDDALAAGTPSEDLRRSRGVDSSGTVASGDATSPPDGAPGNPPGTKASRGVDDALGTNISGARPENERPRR